MGKAEKIFLGHETILYVTITVDTCYMLLKPKGYITPRVTSDVNHGL
jgi:hypothetical protein